MKKRLSILTLMAALTLSTSCSKDDNAKDMATPSASSPTEQQQTVPFAIKVNTGKKLSKIAYYDDGTDVIPSFTEDDVNLPLIMTITGDGISGTATLKSTDGYFEGGLNTTPAIGTKLTATITIAASGENSDYSTESLEKLMEKCAHIYSKTFTYPTTEITLTDQTAFLEIFLSPLQASVKINEKMYTMDKSSDGKRSQVWIAVSSANDISSNFYNKKAEDITPGTIYTIDHSGEVDLGIPGILWADHNLGGTNPWDYGDYYAWGEIYPNYADGHAYDDPVADWRKLENGREFEKYNWDTYSYFDCWGSVSDFWYYTIGGDKQLANKDDAAYCYNNKQSIPTPDDFTQLKTKCFWVWTDKYGGQTFNNKNSSGYIIYAAKKARFAGYVAYGNTYMIEQGLAPKDYKNYSANFNWETDTHIFLPAPGYRYGDRLNSDGELCHYWTSMLDPAKTTSEEAINLYFTNIAIGQRGDLRCMGFSIRPVRHCPIN